MNDKLSICITVKNRSKVETEFGILNLFPNCIKSIKDNTGKNIDNIEIIISDWESTDWPIIEWIGNIITDIPIELITVKTDDKSFSAGKGRNICANRASGDILLFLDADIIFTEKAFLDAWNLAKDKQLCYPVIMYQQAYKSPVCTVHEGGGIFFVSKELFYKAGKWPEYYGHGFEDTDMAQALRSLTSWIPTSPTPFIHQWHPQNKEWKNRYIPNPSPVIEQRKQYYKTQSEKHIENWFAGGLKDIMSNTNFSNR